MPPIPMLDHYYGRKVEMIEEHPEGEGKWYVALEGGAHIINTNEDYDMPEAETLVGAKFSKMTMDGGMTTLYFGTDDNPLRTVMMLDPTQFQISDPDYEDGMPINPQMAMIEYGESMTSHAQTEASAPGEREVDGPSDEFMEAQEREREQALQMAADAEEEPGEGEGR